MLKAKINLRIGKLFSNYGNNNNREMWDCTAHDIAGICMDIEKDAENLQRIVVFQSSMISSRPIWTCKYMKK